MTTPRDLIKAALTDIGAIGAGDSIDGEDLGDLFARCNRMLSSWSVSGALIFADTTISKLLTSGDGEYTIGVGGDINTPRPISIKAAYYRSGDTDTPLELIDERRYAQIANKSAQDSPEYLYYKTGHPTGTIILWPVPAHVETLYMDVEAPLTAFTSLSQTISLPEGYEETIQANLSKRYAPSYSRPVPMEIDEIAREGLANIKRANRKNDIFLSTVNAPGSGRNTGFDIYARRYN